MIRSLVVVTLTVFGATSIVSCGGPDLVIDDRTDEDPTDDDQDGDGDSGPRAPIAPQLNIQVYDITSTTVLVRWTHNAPEGCCTYNVYYGGSQTGPFTLVGEVTDFPRITGLSAETVYFVYVTAVRDGLESVPSVTRSVLTKPALPTGFRVDRVGAGGVLLTWDAVDGASGFNVYRSEPGAIDVSETSPSVHVAGGATSAVVEGLESSSTYTFKMNVEKGVFRLGDLSDAVSATTTAPMTVGTFTPDHGFSEQHVTVTGTDFGTLASEVTVIFEGEAGPGDERTAAPVTLSDGSVSVAVPVGSKTGPISVRRFLYGKATSATPYEVGALFAVNRIEQGGGASQRIVSIHTVTPTRALAGRADGTLLRTLQGIDFVSLDYGGALAGALDCAGDPGDTSAAVSLTSIQCVSDDCLVARGGTCNAIRIGHAFDAVPDLAVKRIGAPSGVAIGPASLLACGNATNVLGCASLHGNGGAVTMTYTADVTTSDFAAVPTAPASNTYTNLRGRTDSSALIFFGDALRLGALPFSSYTDFASGAAGTLGGDCTSDADGSHCAVAVGVDGLQQGSVSSGPVTDVVFGPVLDVPAASFNDAQCVTHRKCIAVGGYDIGLATERGVVAQTFDGDRWFYRWVGERELTAVSCLSDRCFIGDRDGGIWSAVEP